MTTQPHVLEVAPEMTERHYTVPELAKQWNLARTTVREMFAGERGVLRLGERRLRKGKTRTYVTMRIPQSVALRVYRRRTQAV